MEPKQSVTMETPRANPKDSMKSTWRSTDRSDWTIFHWFYEVLDVHPSYLDKEVPVHSKEDPVPHMSNWLQNRWVLIHSFIPLAIHQAYVTYTGKNLGPIAAFFFYTVAFKVIAIHELHLIRRLGHTYGFFDGDKHERDGVPDLSVVKVFRSLITTSTFRPLMSVFLAYRTSQTPASLNWAWLPLEIGLYGIVLDFWFYWYHRLMHDIGGLWQYHRTHHLTKHPNPLLTLYADTEQEIFDIAGIPLLAWGTLRLMGLPMSFYEWWICHQYVVYAELAGHSGLRVHASPPSTLTWLLKYFNAELIIEDHDLHHRKGWKKSHNYGKQTRLWDRIFGTCHERIECPETNIDYKNTAIMPLYNFGNPSFPSAMTSKEEEIEK
jgi:sterol desaturase/sphingolipid hydroxylase (fatty acid hydroxylase superfamily)